MLDKDGMRRLCDSLAKSADLNVGNIARRFEQMWDTLEEKIKAVRSEAGEQPPSPDIPIPERLDALANAVKSLESAVTRLTQRSTPRIGDRLGGQILIASREHGVTDATGTVEHVLEIAERFRPVADVQVGHAGGTKPRITLVLGGEKLTSEEFSRFMDMVQHIPADVMIVPPQLGA